MEKVLYIGQDGRKEDLAFFGHNSLGAGLLGQVDGPRGGSATS